MSLSQDVIDALDPGIRDLVVRLNKLGFDTCDSGDGVTKPAAGWSEDEALRYPHVFSEVDPEDMVYESLRLFNILGPEWNVECSYSPSSGIALLLATKDGRR
jgi:hypothetical protein